jgi:NADP-dependent 3-hydroxy acid dehydrogenase YdfG
LPRCSQIPTHSPPQKTNQTAPQDAPPPKFDFPAEPLTPASPGGGSRRRRRPGSTPRARAPRASPSSRWRNSPRERSPIRDVTGGTKGVGAAVAAWLRELGAKVLITARSSPQPGDQMLVAADVTTIEGCATIVDAVRQRLGGVDIFVHVVGGSSATVGGIAVLDDEEWQKELNLNPFPAVRLARALLPGMIEQGSGVTSIQRQMSSPNPPLPPGASAWCASHQAGLRPPLRQHQLPASQLKPAATSTRRNRNWWTRSAAFRSGGPPSPVRLPI